IQAAGGTGKTALLQRFQYLCRFGDLNAAAVLVSLAAVMRATPQAFLEHLAVSLRSQGLGHSLYDEVYSDVPASTRGRDFWDQSALRAFGADLRVSAGARKVVILVDDFDTAPSDMQAWLIEGLVPALASYDWLGLVIAGRFGPAGLGKRVASIRVQSID